MTIPSAAAPHSSASICMMEGVFTCRRRVARGIVSVAVEVTNASDHVADGMMRAHDELRICRQPCRKLARRALSSTPRDPARGGRWGQSDDDLPDGTKTPSYITERGVGSQGLHSGRVHRELAYRGHRALGVAESGACPRKLHLGLSSSGER